MKKKTKIDSEVVRKLLFPKDQSKWLNVSEAAKKLGCTKNDIVKSMKEWIGKHIYNPIKKKWE
jgi:hypothetical protein